MASEFLKTQQIDPESIESVKQLILATSHAEKPEGLAAQVLRDADLSYLGTPDYWLRARLLRSEFEYQHEVDLSEQEWVKINSDFFESNHYFTPSAKKFYGEEKDRNYQELLKMLSK